MTTQREDRRPKPPWLERKHAGLSDLDREIRQSAADMLLAALQDGQRAGQAGSVPQRAGDGREPPFDPDTSPGGDARQHNSFLNDVARRIGLSYSGRLTDPTTGKCEFCETGWREDKLRCPPSPPGGVDIHWRVWDRSHGRAHVVDHYGPNPDDWHYPPGSSGGSRKHRADGPPADRRFGDGHPAAPAEDEEDSLPADPRPIGTPSTPKPPAASTRPTARGSGSGKTPQQRAAPQGGNWLERMRRSLG